MELTQIHGQNLGQKINTKKLNPLTIGSLPGNNIQGNSLPGEAAKIEVNDDGKRTITPTQGSPVFVNGKQIKKTSPVAHGDTLSFGKDHNVVLGVHPEGTNLGPGSVGDHLGKLNFNSEDIADITHKMFNFKENREILKPIFILGSIITVLAILVFISFIKVSGLKSEIDKEKSKLLSEISDINDQLEIASTIVGSSFYEDEFSECEEDDEECLANETERQVQSLKEKIESVNTTLSSLKTEQKKTLKEIEESLEKVSGDEKAQIGEIFPEKDKEVFSEKYDTLSAFSIIIKLDEVFGKVVEDINNEIKLLSQKITSSTESTEKEVKSFQEFKNDLKQEIKDIEKFSSNFETEKTNTTQKIVTLDNKVTENEKSIKTLEKEDDSLEVEIKKLKEEINSLEIKIKDLSK